MAGLLISSDEFLRLPQKQQLKVLYENQVASFCQQENIFKLIKGYKLHQKIQYPWLVALTGSAIFIIKQITKII